LEIKILIVHRQNKAGTNCSFDLRFTDLYPVIESLNTDKSLIYNDTTSYKSHTKTKPLSVVNNENVTIVRFGIHVI